MINSSSSPDKTYTVQQFIEMAPSDDITYYNTSLSDYIDGFEYNIINILYDYIDDLNEYIVRIKLNDLEMEKYKYRPHLLAYDIYKATEAGFIIRILNGFIDDKEFNFKYVKVIHPKYFFIIIGRIISANIDILTKNKNSIREKVKYDKPNSVWQ